MSQAPQIKVRKSPPTSGPAPRKRRRRNVVSGAAHDCFTCARRGSSCDRGRPYCAQCLEYGLNCLGYKTTLTWGVGVASRGKFRGLSLPVTGSQPVAEKPNTPRETCLQEPALPPTPTIAASQPHPRLQQPSPVSDTTYELNPPAIISSPQCQAWIPCNESRLHTVTTETNPSLLCTGATHCPMDVVESALITESCAGEVSPPLAQSPAILEWPYFSQTPDAETDEMAEELKERRNSRGYCPTGHSQSPSLSQIFLARSVGRTPRLRYLISYYAEVIAPVIVAFDSPENPFRTFILRMAQDSISLQEAIATLSTSNLRQRRERGIIPTGRTESARMSSLAHLALTEKSIEEWHGPSVRETSTREEQYHRGTAVRELNKELADPRKRLSDSVLATLLILCLFHACDTGVAQFKTQFAGVAKLLAIRMRTSSYLSDELMWFVRMFTWFDTMTATTNDREVQLHRTWVDFSPSSDAEWGLENLAGCDSGLFKIISHLGRLNLLSKGQESSAQTALDVFIPTTIPPLSMCDYTPTTILSGTPAQVHPYIFPLPTPPRLGETKQPFSPTFWAEWFSIRQQLEAWRIPRERLNPTSPGAAYFPVNSSSATHEYISPPSSPLGQCRVAPQNAEDVFHISESFRHSAILYSERLAYPDLPSGHPRIQQIVQRSMAHLLAVKSDAYLLWPLFITGSECVLEEHRMVIQERCRNISRDSGFFNNLSCLELLQKIWAENPPPAEMDEGSRSNYAGTPQDGMPVYHSWSGMDEVASLAPGCVSRWQGFRWQQVMQAKRAEGECMVV